jgi:hypothetical protein
MFKRIIKAMSKITINGNVISTSGRNVVVNNGKVFIDGVDVTPDSKTINISVEGDIDKLDVDACSKVEVVGKVGQIKTASGDVEVDGDISGSVSTMSGDVRCGDVGGNVTTMSGDVMRYGL